MMSTTSTSTATVKSTATVSMSSSSPASSWIILSSLMFLQCISSAASYTHISLSGAVSVTDMAGPGRVKVQFMETDFQGLTISMETDKDEALRQVTGVNEMDGSVLPYQKMEGVVDCVNDMTGDDNVVIVSGTIQGTAEAEGVHNEYFQAGDRFLTAVVGNHRGNQEGNKDQLGEISNLGPQENPDDTDCLYFFASDFDLREVASGHITILN